MFTYIKSKLTYWYFSNPENLIVIFMSKIRLFIFKHKMILWIYNIFFSKFPEQIQIELTNYCNLSCIMCPHSLGFDRPKGIMSNDLFRNIIDQIAEQNKMIPIAFVGWGEPLMDKQILDRISYAKQKGIQFLQLFSNGNIRLEDREFVSRLVSSGLNMIFIDIDANEPETYSKIRVKGSFDKLLSNIQILLDENRKQNYPLLVLLGFLIQEENEKQLYGFYQRWRNIPDVICHIKTIHTIAGKANRSGNYILKNKIRYSCHAPWGFYHITWDGLAMFCCHDPSAIMIMGNANESNIFDIWNTKHRKARNEMIRNNYSNLPLCRNCEDWKNYEEGINAKIRIKDSFSI